MKCSHGPFTANKQEVNLLFLTTFLSSVNWFCNRPSEIRICRPSDFQIRTTLLSDPRWGYPPFLTFPGVWEFTAAPLQRPAPDRRILSRSLENPLFSLFPRPTLLLPWLGAATTHFSQTCSPDAHGTALPGGVRDNPKTNGGTSINTWSQDGKEVLPGLYITVVNNKSIHSDP